MTRAARTTAWWTVPPGRQASYLVGADPELLGIALDPLPPSAPAVVRFRPATGAPLNDQVAVILDELERAAVATFPRWLPGAERLDGPGRLGTHAVRELAKRAAARTPDFGPLLADLAEHGLRVRAGEPLDHHTTRRSHLPAEVRAAGLARIIANAYGRDSAALLIEVPPDLSPADEQSLVAAAEWLAGRGDLTVWLAGAPLNVVDRVRLITITLPARLTQLVAEAELAAGSGGEPASGGAPLAESAPVLSYPPMSGVPRQDSAAEQALERALAPHEWANGRRWNHTYERHLLSKPYRLDLFWPAEGLVVEVDGEDHRRPLKFADDRRRDVELQLLGHDVLRFTNEQVLADVQIVVVRIRQLLDQRRAAQPNQMEMKQHVPQ